MDCATLPRMSEIREAVRERYSGLAKQLAVRPAENVTCCDDGSSCCGSYGVEELSQLGLTETVSLGCGNPTLLAALEPGEKVLDLGSGGGLDVLLSARRVAPGGHVFGVDMTDEMLELARANQTRTGIDNATFLKGAIENVPLPDASVDVVISNCVINLAEDKGAVIREAFRVLRPGGRFAVADMVEVETLAPVVKQRLDQWAGCISGTIPVDRYRELLETAGFGSVDIEVHETHGVPGEAGKIASAYLRAVKPEGSAS
jgi:arsenite methyltransferase